MNRVYWVEWANPQWHLWLWSMDIQASDSMFPDWTKSFYQLKDQQQKCQVRSCMWLLPLLWVKRPSRLKPLTNPKSLSLVFLHCSNCSEWHSSYFRSLSSIPCITHWWRIESQMQSMLLGILKVAESCWDKQTPSWRWYFCIKCKGFAKLGHQVEKSP